MKKDHTLLTDDELIALGRKLLNGRPAETRRRDARLRATSSVLAEDETRPVPEIDYALQTLATVVGVSDHNLSLPIPIDRNAEIDALTLRLQSLVQKIGDELPALFQATGRPYRMLPQTGWQEIDGGMGAKLETFDSDDAELAHWLRRMILICIEAIESVGRWAAEYHLERVAGAVERLRLEADIAVRLLSEFGFSIEDGFEETHIHLTNNTQTFRGG